MAGRLRSIRSPVTRVARDVYANHLLPVEGFGTTAVIYAALTFSMVGIFK